MAHRGDSFLLVMPTSRFSTIHDWRVVPNRPVIERALGHARRAYGDLSAPHYHFFGWALEEDPYVELVAELSIDFTVRDTTDVHGSDVCFTYSLTKGTELWICRFSAVGPFALVYRLLQNDRGLVVHRSDVLSDVRALPPHEARLLTIIASRGLELLDPDVVETLVNFSPVNDTSPAPLYQVLYSDDEIPWM